MFSAMHGSSVAHANAEAHSVHVKVGSDPGPFQAEFIMKSLLKGPCAHAPGPIRVLARYTGTRPVAVGLSNSAMYFRVPDVPRTCERARQTQHDHLSEEHLTGGGVFEKQRTVFCQKQTHHNTETQTRNAKRDDAQTQQTRSADTRHRHMTQRHNADLQHTHTQRERTTQNAQHTHIWHTTHKQTPRASDTRATREEHAHNTRRQERKERAGHRVRLPRTLSHGGTWVCENSASNPL